MKAYISGALMGSKDLTISRKLYENLGSYCSKNDISPYIPHLNTDPKFYPNIADEEVFQRDFDNLVSSQIMVCYIGEASLGVGAEIVFAVKNKLRIITVIEQDKKASRFVLGLLKKYNNHTSINYSNLTELETKLTKTFKHLKTEMTAYNTVYN